MVLAIFILRDETGKQITVTELFSRLNRYSRFEYGKAYFTGQKRTEDVSIFRSSRIDTVSGSQEGRKSRSFQTSTAVPKSSFGKWAVRRYSCFPEREQGLPCRQSPLAISGKWLSSDNVQE